MTNLVLIKQNKKLYANLQNKIKTMPEGLEKDVAIHMTLKWIKGKNWKGGLGNSEGQKAYEKLQNLGYTEFQIFDEFDRQMEEYLKEMA